MASEEAQYSSDSATNKRKYDDASPPSITRRPTGFSAPILSDKAPPSSYNNVAPPTTDFEIAKQRAQEIAARLLNSNEAKRAKNDSPAFDSPVDNFVQKPPVPSFTPPAYGYQGGSQESKAIDIPNGKVGVIIGKGGETIKQLQAQSGAKIQVTRDMDADPYSQTRKVDLTGTPDQIARAEQLIKDVLAEAETGGSGAVSRRMTGQQPGAEQYISKIPNNKVGLVIGKGGETIKNMQAQSNARIQVIPLHLPPGDPATERTLQIDGTPEQIEIAKQLVNEVISENRVRNPSMGGYSQQGYQARPPSTWAPPVPPMQQPAYGGYMQQPGPYPTGQTQYNNTPQQQYPGYPPQPATGGYSAGWDQTTGAPSQQTTQGVTGYDTSAYAYPQQAYNQQSQGYSQEGYGTYDQQQQGYGSAPNYTVPNNSSTTTDNNAPPSYGAQGDTTATNQAPPPVQTPASGQGYGAAAGTQQGYGAPSSQPGYGAQPPPSGYAPSYGPPQPAGAQYGYGGGAAQPGYGPPPYGAPAGYGQPPPQYNSSYGYSQPPAYSADTNATSAAQTVPPNGVAQASPQQSK